MIYAVVGSRSLADSYEAVALVLDSFFIGKKVDCICHGGAEGVDSHSGAWAEQNGIPVKIFEADWEKFGASAGPIRNQLIVNHAECVLAILDSRNSRSWGTKLTISMAEKAGKPVYVLSI